MTIAITVASTVLGGITVFVIGQVFVVLFLERIRTQARCVEEIAQALVLYAQFYSNPLPPGTPNERVARVESAGIEIRRLAGLLRANAQTLRFYRIWRFCKLVMPRKDVVTASGELIFLSNMCPPTSGEIKAVFDAENEIKKLLRIDSE